MSKRPLEFLHDIVNIINMDNVKIFQSWTWTMTPELDNDAYDAQFTPVPWENSTSLHRNVRCLRRS